MQNYLKSVNLKFKADNVEKVIRKKNAVKKLTIEYRYLCLVCGIELNDDSTENFKHLHLT